MLLLNEKQLQKLEKALQSEKRIPTAEEMQLLYRMIYILYDECITEKEGRRKHDRFFDALTVIFACIMVGLLIGIAYAVISTSSIHIY